MELAGWRPCGVPPLPPQAAPKTTLVLLQQSADHSYSTKMFPPSSSIGAELNPSAPINQQKPQRLQVLGCKGWGSAGCRQSHCATVYSMLLLQHTLALHVWVGKYSWCSFNESFTWKLVLICVSMASPVVCRSALIHCVQLFTPPGYTGVICM